MAISHIYMYIYVCVRTGLRCLYDHIYIDIHIYIYVYVDVCVYVSACIHVLALRLHNCSLCYVRALVASPEGSPDRVREYIQIHIYIYTYIYIYNIRQKRTRLGKILNQMVYHGDLNSNRAPII